MLPFLRARYIAPLLIVFVGACGSLPAQVPPQLQHTPGPSLVVQERTLQTASYQVDPPAGWRIVKSTIASEPIVLVLVAPDDVMMMTIGDAPLAALPEDADFVLREAVVTLPNGQSVYLRGQGKREMAAQFETIFEAVQSSIRLSESMD